MQEEVVDITVILLVVDQVVGHLTLIILIRHILILLQHHALSPAGATEVVVDHAVDEGRVEGGRHWLSLGPCMPAAT